MIRSLQRGILRRIQCLPDRVFTVAVYGLLGKLPTEQEFDIRKLSLLDEASLEYEIAQRQFAVKDINSDSWFMQCLLILHSYGLPSVGNSWMVWGPNLRLWAEIYVLLCIWKEPHYWMNKVYKG